MIREIDIGNKRIRLIADRNFISLRWGNREIVKPEPMRIGEKFGMGKIQDAVPDGVDVHLFDADYQHIEMSKVKSWLEKNKISEEDYVSNKHDCENFAFKTWVEIQDWFGYIPFGVAIGYCSWLEGYHAFNIFFDNEWKMYLIEPQNDNWYPYNPEEDEIHDIYI